jgi:hypothetical protein
LRKPESDFHTVNYMRVQNGVQLKSDYNTAKPDRPQNNDTAANGIAQQYFPTTVVSFHFQFL